jgi:hypothetical protein
VKLPLDADRATYHEWLAFQRARVDNRQFFTADFYDMVINFAVARRIAVERPDLVPQLAELVPDHLERCAAELGTFMGVAAMAKAVGFDQERARELALEVIGG